MADLGYSSDIRPQRASEYKFNVRLRLHVRTSADYIYMRKTRMRGSRFGVQEPGTVNLYDYNKRYKIDETVPLFLQDSFVMDPKVVNRVPAARRFGRKMQEYFGSMLDREYHAPEAKPVDPGQQYWKTLYRLLQSATNQFKQAYRASAGKYARFLDARCDPVAVGQRVIVTLRVPFFAVMFSELGSDKLQANHAFASAFNSTFGMILPYRINTSGFPEVIPGG